MFGDGSCQPGIDFKLHELKEGHNDNHYNYYFILSHITIASVCDRYGTLFLLNIFCFATKC